VEVDLSSLQDPVLAAPTYRCISRRLWIGTKHAALYGQIRNIAQAFRARYLVADATGVGAGLVSFLTSSLGAADPATGKSGVIPFVFNGSSKSKLGWDFIGIVEAGRWQDWSTGQSVNHLTDATRPIDQLTYATRPFDREAETFWREIEFCQYEVLPGPAHLLRWGVPAGTRDPATGDLVHDDTVLSAALVAVLDELPWAADTGAGTIIRTADPLATMNEGF